MTSHKSKSRASSKSPTQGQTKPEAKTTKTSGGGVKLPIVEEKVDEKNSNGMVSANHKTSLNGGSAPMAETKVPNLNGPQQDGGMTAANINSFGGNSVQGLQANDGAKLSAGATAFKPTASKTAPISFLNRDSTADDTDGPVIVSSDMPSTTKPDKGKGKAVQQPIGTRGANFSPGRPRVVFTTDVGPDVVVPGGHYVKIVNAPIKEIGGTLDTIYKAYGWNPKVRGTHCPRPNGSNFLSIFLCFNDIRHAGNAFEEIQAVNTNWTARYISQCEYAASKRETHGSGTDDTTSFYDGQVIFTAQFEGLSSDFSLETLVEDVHKLAKSAGEVLAFTETDGEGGVWQFRVEYFDISDAKAVVKQITKAEPAHIGKWTIFTTELPDLIVQTSPIDSFHILESDVDAVVTPQKAVGLPGVIYASPTGRTAWNITKDGVRVPAPAPKQLPKTIMAHSNGNMTPPSRNMSDPFPQTPTSNMGDDYQAHRPASWSGPGYPTYGPPQYGSNHYGPDLYGQSHYGDQYGANHYSHHTPYNNRHSVDIGGTPTSVDVEKIRTGQDVRTTVMLRNLPNNIDFRQLKQIIDDVCHGKYDFSYLRVDFTNNLNVGYGFVNFTDPMHIVAFVQRYVGRPWMPRMRFNRRRGPRIADVSYATVQGLDCLIEKFRNSSVMDEFPDFRPKLWYTYENTRNLNNVGQEKPFPSVNNTSKHQRSRDNATQVGLYQSGNRRNRNNNGRHPQSQYDRGTTAQLNEDAFHSHNMNHMSPLQNGYQYAQPTYMFGGAPMAMAPPPPPQFQPVPFGNTNGGDQYGNGYVNSIGAVQPYGYGYVPFTDPFVNVNGGYAAGSHMPGRVHNNVQHPSSGRRFYQSGIDTDRIPKSITEENSGPNEVASYSNGQHVYGNANGGNATDGQNHTYGPQY